MNYDIAIWGTGKMGKYIENQLKGKSINVSCFIDSNPERRGKKINGTDVISAEHFEKICADRDFCVLLSVKNSKNYFDVVRQLEKMRVKQIGIVKPRAEAFGLDISIENDDEIIWVYKSEKMYNIIPRIEMNLIDGCNLKCIGCTHFSSIYSEDSICPIDSFQSDMSRLRESCDALLRLRLLGGEPLLIPDIDKYIEISRNIFPESDIEVVTNGLLIPELSEKILRSFAENNISVIMSPYKPTFKNIEKINAVLDKYNVHHCFSEGDAPIEEFSRNLTLKNDNNMHISSKKCASYGCTFLRNGNLYKCPFDGLIKDFEKYYSVAFEVDKEFNIHENSIEDVYGHIKKLACEPVLMCKYCSEDVEMIKWGVNKNPLLSDWLYNEPDNKSS